MPLLFPSVPPVIASSQGHSLPGGFVRFSVSGGGARLDHFWTLQWGWGGDGEHMLDARQPCLFCPCTHAGCYATVCVLS